MQENISWEQELIWDKPGTLTLDMNGYTLSDIHIQVKKGTVILKNGTIQQTDREVRIAEVAEGAKLQILSGSYMGFFQNAGELLVMNGEFTGLCTGMEGTATQNAIIKNSGSNALTQIEGGSFKMQDGKYTRLVYGVWCESGKTVIKNASMVNQAQTGQVPEYGTSPLIYVESKGTVEIQNGSFVNDNEVIYNKGNLTISGGNFVNTGRTCGVSYSWCTVENSGTLKVIGGTLIGPYNVINSHSGTVFLHKGTLKIENQEFCMDLVHDELTEDSFIVASLGGSFKYGENLEGFIDQTQKRMTIVEKKETSQTPAEPETTPPKESENTPAETEPPVQTKPTESKPDTDSEEPSKHTEQKPTVSSGKNRTLRSTAKTVTIAWKKDQNATAGYRIYVKSGKKYVKVGTTKAGTTRFTIKKIKGKSLKPGTTYTVRIASLKRVSGKLKEVKKITFKTASKPKTPIIISGKKKGSSKAVLKWKKIPGVSGYEIQMSTKAKKGFKKIASVKSLRTTFTKGKLKKGKTYYFRIRAYKTVTGGKVYSAWSKTQKVK